MRDLKPTKIYTKHLQIDGGKDHHFKKTSPND